MLSDHLLYTGEESYGKLVNKSEVWTYHKQTGQDKTVFVALPLKDSGLSEYWLNTYFMIGMVCLDSIS